MNVVSLHSDMNVDDESRWLCSPVELRVVTAITGHGDAPATAAGRGPADEAAATAGAVNDDARTGGGAVLAVAAA